MPDLGVIHVKCAWCERWRVEEDHWVSLPPTSLTEDDPVTHGICPTCYSALMPDEEEIR